MSDYGTPPPPPPSAPGYNQPTAGGTPPPNYLVLGDPVHDLLLPPARHRVDRASPPRSTASTPRGDVAGAQESSAKARRFAMIAAVVGIVVNGLYFAFVLPISAR